MFESHTSMGNGDNLPFDILPFIFQHLHQSDLVAAALVSRTFASGALPKLYEVIIIDLSVVNPIERVGHSSLVSLRSCLTNLFLFRTWRR